MKPEFPIADALPELAYPAQGENAPEPELLLLNEDLTRELGFDPHWLRSKEGINFLLGQNGGYALAYAGHQFGHYNPLMGDGRALLLGEFGGFEVQAKGIGRTPFSKRGDGRGPLDAMLREYLISEYMHAVGIPTTRGLAVISTGRKVQRQQVVPAGVSVRVARSHLRVGTFELVRQSPELMERLEEYTWAKFPGGIAGVAERQCQTVAEWMGVGFVHGVMNTDNCSISGETIDYGPCAFLDRHDPAACFSSIDVDKRYAYGRQPAILHWNLQRLGFDGDFPGLFSDALAKVWSRKLGTEDPERINNWFSFLAEERPDHTLAHADLSGKNPQVIPRNLVVQQALDAANKGNVQPFLNLHTVLQKPYAKPSPEYQQTAENYVTFCGT